MSPPLSPLRSPPLILLLALAGLVLLGVRLGAQVAAQRAEGRLARGDQQGALALLERAVRLQPGDAALRLALGEILEQIGGARPQGEALAMAQRARMQFEAAAHLSPSDYTARYALARAVERLAQLGEPQAGDPVLELRHAVALAPRNVRLRYALARSLHRHGPSAEVPAAAADLVRLYPPIAARLRGEGFWTPAARSAALDALRERIDAGGADAATHFAAAALHQENSDPAAAARHYERALVLEGSAPASHRLLQLGGLLLEAGDIPRAEERFLQAIETSAQPERELADITGRLKRAGRIDRALALYQEAEQRRLIPENGGLQLARVLLELGQLPEARALLEKVNRRRPDPEAWTLLARIAEREADWDAMELAAQKAAMLDASRPEAHLLFAQALVRLKKWERAETELDLALALSTPPSAGLYHQRAVVRMARGDPQGAAEDWQAAARLEPHKPQWQTQAAAALEKAQPKRAEGSTR
jgi:tetratricopeptide (TPR) repeat protein